VQANIQLQRQLHCQQLSSISSCYQQVQKGEPFKEFIFPEITQKEQA